MGFQNFAYIFGAVIAVAIVAGIIYSIALARKIQKNGVEADAVLTRVETHTTTDNDDDLLCHVCQSGGTERGGGADDGTAPFRAARRVPAREISAGEAQTRGFGETLNLQANSGLP